MYIFASYCYWDLEAPLLDVLRYLLFMFTIIDAGVVVVVVVVDDAAVIALI